MKEIENSKDVAIEKVDQTQVKKSVKAKTFNIQYNHNVFEINTETGECEKAKYDTGTVDFVTGKVIKNLVENDKCIYIPALNKINAKRKFDNIVNKVLKDDK